MEKFKYLGSTITNKNEIEVEIDSRIACGSRARWALKDIFRRGWPSRTAKVEVYTKVIRPTVLYGCETWRLTQKLENKLDVFENGILRTICGPVYDQEERGWRRRHNRELRDITSLPLLSAVVRSRRLQWAGHVARRDDDHILKRVTISNPAGRRPVGRPRKRWVDGVTQDTMLLTGGDNWKQQAEDREDWRKVVAAAMGLQGLRPAE